MKESVIAVMTLDQVAAVIGSLRHGAPASISVFAGRIADAGCNPLPILCAALPTPSAATSLQ